MTAPEHAEIQELLGAYALDALDLEERATVEEHLAGCPRCAAEARDHMATAAMLGSVGEPPPEGLWDRIAGSLETRAPEVVPFPLDRARAGDGRRRRILTSGIGVAAAVAVGLLTWRVVDQQRQIDDLGEDVALSDSDGSVTAVLSEPGSELMTLQSEEGDAVARAVVADDGQGFLLGDPLPALDQGRTYQLWAVTEDGAVSLGVLGPEPGLASFDLGPSADQLALTSEPDGGSVSPEGPLVAEAQFA